MLPQIAKRKSKVELFMASYPFWLYLR